MNLLFLTPSLPYPPDQGTAIRNWGLISGLALRHRVTLLTFAHPHQDIHSTLRTVCARVETVLPSARKATDRLYTLLFSRRPDLQDRLGSREFYRRLRQILTEEKFDVIHIEGLEMATYAIAIRHSAWLDHSPTLIFDAHNAEVVIQQRAFQTDLRHPHRWPAALYSLIQLPRLRRLEQETCNIVDNVLCVSEEDAIAISQFTSGVNPVLVPNGLFLADYDLPISYAPLPSCSLVFSGKMDYRPNVDAATWFANEIFPHIRTHLKGEVEFVIVGKNPTRRIMDLGQRPNTTITGYVEDVRPYLAAATVYVAPLRMGGGTRFKLLEAMALKRAIVTTTIGAEGFAVTSGRELMVADSSAQQAKIILSLLEDANRRIQLGTEARAFVEQYSDWSNILPALETLY
jgi:glycosyltransferase involved in cell wall biosynthesis